MSLYDLALAQVNRTADRNRRPFDLTTDTAAPHGRWGVVHYGIMAPDLPEPFRFFDIIVILGTSKAPIFDNRELVVTTPEDSAWVLVGSGPTRDSFRSYSIAGECDIAADGTQLRFGDELLLERSAGTVRVHAAVGESKIVLDLRLTDVVSHFAHLPGLYDHWSVLCEYSGTFTTGGATVTRNSLCTYEYARAVNLPLPFLFFTYQILNIDERTQVLMVEVLGPVGVVVQRTVYVRTIDGGGQTFSRGFAHTVTEHAAEPLVTPHGRRMRMPKRFSWAVDDDSGDELIRVDGIGNDDFAFGMAAGYAGSYDYTGRFRGEPIAGTGYIEWIDRR